MVGHVEDKVLVRAILEDVMARSLIIVLCDQAHLSEFFPSPDWGALSLLCFVHLVLAVVLVLLVFE